MRNKNFKMINLMAVCLLVISSLFFNGCTSQQLDEATEYLKKAGKTATEVDKILKKFKEIEDIL